ncbi:hypothetical protein JDV02_005755 [Purpureocillium takamizusanense]|uniref:Homeobox domain-containing protein n=1 Tax=Purpureocillium takamizusanense TaxID=2060973 RepID=A0A9Q8VC87_9HYPO|nr:uncharacterized protein JDV02_005755 [Purpureocillium takamizusanense]UNI19577.1 hypothetical protein JDV02_005755 [Purpureocillium takamizusanense]
MTTSGRRPRPPPRLRLHPAPGLIAGYGPGMTAMPMTPTTAATTRPRPIFTQDAVRTLRRWFAANKHHPYPTRDDKESLCALTGLDVVQVANWFANARRRRIKVGSPPPPPSSMSSSAAAVASSAHVLRAHMNRQQQSSSSLATSPSSPLRDVVGMDASTPIDVVMPQPPRRAPTPGVFEDMMDPLQRWANSPPEDEPAAATAIYRAANEPFYASASVSAYPYLYLSDDGGGGGSSASASNRSSLSRQGIGGGDNISNPRSESSVASSRSSSFGVPPSPLDQAAHHGGSSSHPRQQHHRRRRRRRRNHTLLPARQSTLGRPSRGIFQCTFCVEEFRTKYDWQRHEKTWHLPLDRWVCTPTGPLAVRRRDHHRRRRASSSSPSFPRGNGNGDGEWDEEEDEGGGGDALVCVFCGEEGPDAAHIESHNFLLCNRRGVDERTFYRRDHLMQHLRLVHRVGAGVPGSSFDAWKAAAPPIRSRCGFCGRCLDDWAMRVEHLGEHFKAGSTMRDWVGDWGFDPAVLQTIENSMPPYLLDYERNSPLPYKAGGASPWTPSTAYDLLKMELQYWVMNHLDAAGDQPPDADVQREACRIILSADLAGGNTQGLGAAAQAAAAAAAATKTSPSWLRDLATASPEILQGAMLQTVRGQAENRLTTLRINGKDDIFEGCELERRLLAAIIRAARLRPAPLSNREIQAEAVRIVRQTEERSSAPSDVVAGWLLRMISASTDWLEGVKERALGRAQEEAEGEHQEDEEDGEATEGVGVSHPLSLDDTELDVAALGAQMDLVLPGTHQGFTTDGIVAPAAVFPPLDSLPTTDDDMDLLWALDLSAADDAITPAPLISSTATPPHEEEQSRLYQLHTMNNAHRAHRIHTNTITTASTSTVTAPGAVLASTATTSRSPSGAGASSATEAGGPRGHHHHAQLAAAVTASTRPPYFPNDANAYRRLAHDLARFVAAAVSDKNPNRHVPSDEEIQYQARWLEFDDDDPWNQTAADNPEWLMRFKRDVGLLPQESGPGLGLGYFAAPRHR